jgi:MFS family permease
MPETLHAAPARASNTGMKGLRKQKGVILLAILLVLGGTVSNYVGNYMTTYAIATLKFPPLIAMGATVMVGLTTLAFSLLGGWLSDRCGRKPVMLWPRIATTVLIVPAFGLLIDHPTQGTLLAVTSFLAALAATSGAATLVAIPELLPRGIRATGLSIAYAVGVAIFGGTTQFIVTWLIAATGNPAAPAWYVAGTSVIPVLAMLALPESRDRVLED